MEQAKVSSDGKYCLLQNIAGTVYVYNTSSGKLLYEIEDSHGIIAISADNKFLVSLDKNILTVWYCKRSIN